MRYTDAEMDNVIQTQLEIIPMPKRQVRQNMIAARKAKKLTIVKMAEKLGCSDAYLSHIELGAIPYLPDTLRCKLGNEYNLTWDDIASAARKPKRNFIDHNYPKKPSTKQRQEQAVGTTKACMEMSADEALVLATYLDVERLVEEFTNNDIDKMQMSTLISLSVRAATFV